MLCNFFCVHPLFYNKTNSTYKAALNNIEEEEGVSKNCKQFVISWDFFKNRMSYSYLNYFWLNCCCCLWFIGTAKLMSVEKKSQLNHFNLNFGVVFALYVSVWVCVCVDMFINKCINKCILLGALNHYFAIVNKSPIYIINNKSET